MEKYNAKSCGLVFCYNEEHIIGCCLRYYLNQGFDLVIFDNGSTDASMDIVDIVQKEKYTGKILDVVRVETKGYEWRKILKHACQYRHKSLNKYDWILLIDVLQSPQSPLLSHQQVFICITFFEKHILQCIINIY